MEELLQKAVDILEKLNAANNEDIEVSEFIQAYCSDLEMLIIDINFKLNK